MSIDSTDGPNGCETCREPELLLWLAAGALGDDERARVEESVRRCPACRVRLADDEAFARAVRSASVTPAPLSAESLIQISEGPVVASAVSSLSAEDRAMLDVLRAVNTDLDAWERQPKWREWASRWLTAVIPAPGAGLTAWLRSPAVAYVALMALAYPAYRGLVEARFELSPFVLTAPVGIDGPNRGERMPVITVGEQTFPQVVTAFVPIDEGYRYRIEIVDSAGRSHFRKDDAQSFDAYGTFVIVLPEGFLKAGAYELRVDELGEDGQLMEVFRFPFQVQP